MNREENGIMNAKQAQEKANGLWYGATSAKPIDFDFGQGWTETWEFYEAGECYKCGELVIGSGYTECEKCGNEQDGLEGPMMNYYYPLPKLDHGEEETARLIADLPLCLVYFIEREEYALALTGGGMDLSWEICAAFVALGYLPPVHFAGLPKMAGMTWNDENRLVVAAMRRALEGHTERSKRDIERMDDIGEWLNENTKAKAKA